MTERTESDQPLQDCWGIVEVMGHSRYAGKISEYTGLGVPLVRVQIPETKRQPASEKLLGASSIFRITPCSEAAARAAAEQFRVEPLSLVNLPAAHPAMLPGLDYDGDDDHFDDE